MKILIIDDSRFTCRRMTEMLEAALGKDHEYITESDSEAAIETFNNSNFDYVLMDYNMPKMTGLELAEQLKSKLSYDKMAMVTASSAFATGSQTVPEGMQLVMKPVTEEKLKKLFEDWKAI